MTGPDDIAVLRIELEDIEPLIWRRVAVRTSMNLTAVHGVIQAAMGWLDYHLWEFTAGEHKYGMLLPNDPDWNERIKNAATTKLSALLAAGVREIGYVYDMGDNWQHRIIVEKLKAAEPGALYPQFLGGERRCPPEDCGGFPGYYEFLENMASKQSKKRKVALDWYGGPYNPDDIGEQKIIAALKRFAEGLPGPPRSPVFAEISWPLANSPELARLRASAHEARISFEFYGLRCLVRVL